MKKFSHSKIKLLFIAFLFFALPIASAQEDVYYVDESNTSTFSRNNPLTNIEFGTEISYIKYEEPNFMENEGNMFGVFGVLTYRTMENSRLTDISQMFSEKSSLNYFQLDAKLSWGQVDYDSVSTGSIDDIDDFMFEIRGVTGYDFPVFDATIITPYLGVGYRYLNNDSGGKVSTTGAFGYEREANYLYLPIGIKSETQYDGGWSLTLNAEYDLFLDGEQKSHLGDAIAGLNTLSNDQNDGYGVRGSIKVMKKSDRFDYFVEPFARYWHIEDSEITPVTIGGIAVGFGLEPENESQEYGVKLGLNF